MPLRDLFPAGSVHQADADRCETLFNLTAPPEETDAERKFRAEMLVDSQAWENDERRAALEYLLGRRQPLLMAKSNEENAAASPAR